MCGCPVCERGPGPFDLPCEFKKTAVLIDYGYGPLLHHKQSQVDLRHVNGGILYGSYTDEKFKHHPDWEEKHEKATWEINIPSGGALPWPENLVGLMDFEAAEWLRDNPGCH